MTFLTKNKLNYQYESIMNFLIKYWTCNRKLFGFLKEKDKNEYA